MKIGVQLNVLGEVRHEGDLAILCHRLEDLGEEGEVVGALLLCKLLELDRSGMSVDHEIEELSS